MNLTKSQFFWLGWIARNGGEARCERGMVAAGEEKSSNASAISFLNLVCKGCLEAQSGKLVLTEYGRRCLKP